MKLYQQLEQLLKIRINSNDEIIPGIKRLSEMGKFDEPKKIAILAILLDRVGKMEDEKLLEQSVKETTTSAVLEDIATPDPINAIQQEVDNANAEKEESLLQTTDSSMNGVDETVPTEPSNPTTPETQTPPSASDDVVATTTEEQSASNENPADTTPTVSAFTPENITDPTPQNPVESSS